MKADLKTQRDFEELYHKNQLMRRLKKEFDVPEVTAHLDRFNIPVKFGISLMIQMVLHKRVSLTVLVAIMYKQFEEDNPFQQCVDMILICARDASIVNYDPVSEMFIIKYNVSEDVYQDLDRYQYPLPMLIEPKKVNDNISSGYYSGSVQSSLILRDNHHDDDICLDHINSSNRTKLTINTDTANMIKNTWRNLDKRKPNETKADFDSRKSAFEKYDRASRDIIDSIMMFDNEFYLTHKYDKRGRTYCQGYHVNYQGNAWNKAVIEFADKEIING